MYTIIASCTLMLLCITSSSAAEAKRSFWNADLDKQLKFLELSNCPYQIEPVGCYDDNYHNRGFPNEILNGRDASRDDTVRIEPLISSTSEGGKESQWHNYNHWLGDLICHGAERLFEKKPHVTTDYIGVQYYAEIWADLKGDGKGYDKHGVSSQCIDGDYNPITAAAQKDPTSCGLWAGKAETNYVYKVTKYETVEKKEGCPYFQSKGCWSDIKPWFKKMDARPMEKYALNERDPYASNWNGRLINWGKWGQGYLAGLLCRCADIAKKEGKRFFAIQFYGECWISGGDEERFETDGKTTECVDGAWGVCDMNDGMGKKCRNHYCAGKAEANKVYEIMQGPHKCSTSPCKNEGKCLTVGTQDYRCTCLPGFQGEHCEEAVGGASDAPSTPVP